MRIARDETGAPGAGEDVDGLLEIIGAVQVEVLLEIVREFEQELGDPADGRLLPFRLVAHLEDGCGAGEQAEHEAVVRAIERGSGLARLILLADQLRAAVERKDDILSRD